VNKCWHRKADASVRDEVVAARAQPTTREVLMAKGDYQKRRRNVEQGDGKTKDTRRTSEEERSHAK
jgi:hypothetical protein